MARRSIFFYFNIHHARGMTVLMLFQIVFLNTGELGGREYMSLSC